jgi:hypothetical protein
LNGTFALISSQLIMVAFGRQDQSGQKTGNPNHHMPPELVIIRSTSLAIFPSAIAVKDMAAPALPKIF